MCLQVSLVPCISWLASDVHRSGNVSSVKKETSLIFYQKRFRCLPMLHICWNRHQQQQPQVVAASMSRWLCSVLTSLAACVSASRCVHCTCLIVLYFRFKKKSAEFCTHWRNFMLDMYKTFHVSWKLSPYYLKSWNCLSGLEWSWW